MGPARIGSALLAMEATFTHFSDGTGHKNRMQGNDFAQSVMYTRGVHRLQRLLRFATYLSS